jgi:hypothetical protein
MNKKCLDKQERINNRSDNKRFEGFKNKKKALPSPEKQTPHSRAKF